MQGSPSSRFGLEVMRVKSLMFETSAAIGIVGVSPRPREKRRLRSRVLYVSLRTVIQNICCPRRTLARAGLAIAASLPRPILVSQYSVPHNEFPWYGPTLLTAE